MEELAFITTILLVVILACFAIFMVVSLVYVGYLVVDEWLYERRRKK